MRSTFENLDKYYGIISGLLYSVSYSFVGVFGGQALQKYNRVRILVVAALIWNIANFVTGSASSLGVVAAMRVLLGSALSLSEPAMFSIVGDYFPSSMISTANSFVMAGSYMGAALSSSGVFLTALYGWRNCFKIMCVFGVLCALLMAVVVKEPKRGAFDKVKEEDKPKVDKKEQGNTL